MATSNTDFHSTSETEKKDYLFLYMVRMDSDLLNSFPLVA